MLMTKIISRLRNAYNTHKKSLCRHFPLLVKFVGFTLPKDKAFVSSKFTLTFNHYYINRPTKLAINILLASTQAKAVLSHFLNVLNA